MAAHVREPQLRPCGDHSEQVAEEQEYEHGHTQENQEPVPAGEPEFVVCHGQPGVGGYDVRHGKHGKERHDGEHAEGLEHGQDNDHDQYQQRAALFGRGEQGKQFSYDGHGGFIGYRLSVIGDRLSVIGDRLSEKIFNYEIRETSLILVVTQHLTMPVFVD